MRSVDAKSRTPPVTARSIAPLTATWHAVIGAKGAAAATTPRYHPPIPDGKGLPLCTQILNVIRGTAGGCETRRRKRPEEERSEEEVESVSSRVERFNGRAFF
jgi:hypothetical protein